MQFKSIRSKILISCTGVVFVVVIALSMSYFYSIGNTITKDIRTNQLHTFLEAAQSDLRNELEKAIETSVGLASDPTLMHWFKSGEEDESVKELALDKLDVVIDEFGYMTIFATSAITNNYWMNGHVLNDVVSESDPDDSWFYETLGAGKRVSTAFDYNKELDQTGFFINVVMGDVNRPIGVAGVGLNPTDLVKELNAKRFSENSTMWLIDGNGIVKLAQKTEDINKSLDEIFNTDVLENVVSQEAKGLMSEYEINGGDYEIAYMNIGNTGHKIVMTVPTRELVSMLKPIRRFSIVISVLFLIVAFILALLLSNSLARPIVQLNNVAKSLSTGDLSAKIDSKLLDMPDELGLLANTFNQMKAKISDVILQVKQTTELISDGGTRLTESSNELSSRSMQQATSTEEVSASMEEMGANISQNAENSKQTEQLMSNAYKDTSNGSEIVNKAVEGIKLIAEKVQIIEEIAMQTNILSLNAAVEAARAGEEGRGFAVVATEVRKLAERSREAANEISENATNGVEIAIRAGEIFDNLVPDIQKAYNYVADISAASLEQNEGSKQVNKAILELDSVSQGNASAADKISELTRSFYNEVEQLNEAIKFFKI